MALLIHPDGRVEAFTFTGFDSWSRGGWAFFDLVSGFPKQAGYLVAVDDVGIPKNLPVNELASSLCKYPGLRGPAVVVSFEEADERECMHYIRPEARCAFEARLAELLKKAKGLR